MHLIVKPRDVNQTPEIDHHIIIYSVFNMIDGEQNV